ncbi:MAG TPA: serine/threonine-protein kinase [Polyangiales bacterium]|nr:serine/threonine-protein kinase [Polyangiales bacterium]
MPLSTGSPPKPQTPPAPQIVGQRGGVYEIVQALTEGGMGETFIARRRGAGDAEFLCCLKRMRGRVRREEFLHEAAIASRLQHDCIVRTIDADEDERGSCFLVMELLDGVNLDQLLEHYEIGGRTMPPALVLYVLVQVLEALDYAHTFVDEAAQISDIVHRDVTTTNILITRWGRVKLIDFGIARWRTRPSHTRTGHLKGKYPYTPLEQREKGAVLDARADLFSLGVSAYQMLAGALPFGDPFDEHATVEAMKGGRYIPLWDHLPTLDRRLCDIVHRMISVERDHRPSSARELLRELQGLDHTPFAHTALAADTARCRSELDQRGPEDGVYDDSLELAQGLVAARASAPATRTPSNLKLDSAETPARPLDTLERHDAYVAARTGPRSRRQFWIASIAAVATIGVVSTSVLMLTRTVGSPPPLPAHAAPVKHDEAATHRVIVESPSVALLNPSPSPSAAQEAPVSTPAGTTPTTSPTQREAASEPHGRDARRARGAEAAPTGSAEIRVVAVTGYAYAELHANGRKYRDRSPLRVAKLPPGTYPVLAAANPNMEGAVERTITIIAGVQAKLAIQLSTF